MADVNISQLTSLTAAQISDKDDIRFVVDDLQAAAATKQISLTELELAFELDVAVAFQQTAVPTTGADPGVYFVQTGANRGVYAWTGVEAVLLAPFSQDGDWPV
jgi:hypothetical protein